MRAVKKNAGRVVVALVAVLTLACSTPPPGEGAAATDGPRNKLNWTAATETGVYGYLVYRSESREGPFRRINDSVVRVPADRLAEHRYSYSDHDVEPGVTYHYYLDVVTDAGLKQRFSGIISRTTGEAPES